VCLGVGGRTPGGEDDLAPQPIQLGIRVRLARLRGDRETRLDGAARLGEPPGGQVHLADHQEHARYAAADSEAGPATLGAARQQVGDRLRLAGCDARRGVERPAEAQPERKPVRLGERHQLGRPLALLRSIAPHLVNDRLEEERGGQAEGMAELAGRRDRLASAGERTIGPAELPEIPRGID
jgi:hypothetical protein